MMPDSLPSRDRTRRVPREASSNSELTLLLHAARDGDSVAAERALDLIWSDLRAIAGRAVDGEYEATLEPTAMVHECFVRLVGKDGCHFESRVHFFRTAASCMRRLLIDRARAAARLKRGGGGERLTLDSRDLAPGRRPDDFLALEVAMERLQALDQRKHEVVMLRFFAGLTLRETAECMNVSASTVKADWLFARAWLQRELESA
jgi:RNA polymerase sigma factor (TIGR02999 family)